VPLRCPASQHFKPQPKRSASNARPGRTAECHSRDPDEQFDADRFGVWLEVLVEPGNGSGTKLAKMDAIS